ncbi:hypothetical protein B9T11_09120 [Wohlfahrtiimonas chitiniclastica]|nr:lipoprotein [Wohlfahrtiimonas chitiniclastica]MBS7821497.1 lipoprotein [Wohlfahrtiimonas chitiniclastica]MBS7834890.1 lipoprotein [Wohlfahrtiimonas chitiniclastica]MBS7836755.1 lipoprotein [Wohlfahrtiimonas chitiniclastica]MBS7838851.1 lipoprotein [Wohlfahrtiimonas chitiniclastica]OYQ69291.1 hypothetical protein B9T13_09515 [Wohlfahrtiimonas chitiniclastica]
MKKILCVVGLSFFLHACGQKGPLYLPDQHSTEQQSSSER